MVLVVAVLGLGTGSRPSAAPSPPLAEQGLRGSPAGPVSPGELPEEELPLRGERESEGEETKDAKEARDAEDAQRRRTSTSVFSLAPPLDVHLAARVARFRHAEARHVEPECAHRSQLHNRGPPVA